MIHNSFKVTIILKLKSQQNETYTILMLKLS